MKVIILLVFLSSLVLGCTTTEMTTPTVSPTATSAGLRTSEPTSTSSTTKVVSATPNLTPTLSIEVTKDVLPYINGDPYLPYVLQGRIGDLQIVVKGGLVSDNLPWTGVTCPTPDLGTGKQVVLRVSAIYERETDYSTLGIANILLYVNMEPVGTSGSTHAVAQMWLLPIKGWWETIGLGDHEQWLVFQLPEGWQPNGTGSDLAYTPPLSKQNAFDEINKYPVLAPFRPNIEWRLTTYPEGTRYWKYDTLALVVLDPYTAQWGALPIPDIDPVPDRNISPVCLGGSLGGF